MSKGNKTIKAAIAATNGNKAAELAVIMSGSDSADAGAPPQAPLYSLGKLPRNGLNEGTKHGLGGTAGTYQAVCRALGKGPMTLEAIKAVCKEQNDPGFARYAVRNHWLLPVPTK